MIKIENLNKSYTSAGKTFKVLNNINLEIAKGEVFGIIGRSGAGKSTLLKCLNLLEIPDTGSIRIDNIDLTKISRRNLRTIRHQIGVIFQHFNLLNSKTIFDNIALPLKLQGKHSKAEIKTSVEEMLDLVELNNFADKYPTSLSGGQKQRVGIARALVTKPKLILSDEATSSLDPQTTSSILNLLLEINQKLGVTIILITHEIEVVRKICDKVAVIENGQIIECGNAFDILLHPQKPLTHKLIIEETSDKYLQQVEHFYKFEKNSNRHILLLSFIGETTYQPILNTIANQTNLNFSILRGELDRIKKMPFGQLLVEFNGDNNSLDQACTIMQKMGVHYEIVH